MKWPALTIRSRIQLWHGVLLACILTAFGTTAYKLHWADELRRIDRELNEPLSLMHRAIATRGHGRERNDVSESSPAPGFPPLRQSFTPAPEIVTEITAHGRYFVVWARDGKVLARSDGAPADVKLPQRIGRASLVTSWRNAGDKREAFIWTPPGECLLTGVSTASDRAALSRLGWWLCALGAGVLCLGLVVDSWILRRSIHPVEQIISTAERISTGRLSARIESSGSSAELGRLAVVLNNTFASLDRAFSHQARFSADVAHELRTPVAVLIVEAQRALEKERDGADYRDTIATVLRSAQRMHALIESLLHLAQIQADGAPDAQTTCDLAGITREALDAVRGMAAQQDIAVETELHPARCRGNAAQLAQVATNFLSNAVQHNHRGGKATITTGMPAGRATLCVQSTGPGIAAEDLPHLFERFFRADASRSRKSGGVGLGLAICKAIAEAHNATLSVSSDPVKGTAFTLSMPMEASAGDAAEKPPLARHTLEVGAPLPQRECA